MSRDYAHDLVDIKGKKYQPVSSRLQMAQNPPPEMIARLKGALMQSCTTEVLYRTDDYIGVKVSVQLKDEYGGGVFDGVSESDRKAKSVEGDSPLEVAETSALGRALAKAGILLDLAELAASNEMRKAQAQSRPQQQPVSIQPQRPAQPPQAPRALSSKVPPVCVDCGSILQEFVDKSKRVYSVEELVEGRLKKYGRVLCTPCSRDASRVVQGSDGDTRPEEGPIPLDMDTPEMSEGKFVETMRELTNLEPKQALIKMGYLTTRAPGGEMDAMVNAVSEIYGVKIRSNPQIYRLFTQVVAARLNEGK